MRLVTRQSGWRKGEAGIGGDRAALRCRLFTPAAMATRFNVPIQPLNRTPLAAGQPWKFAAATVTREVTDLADALIRDDRKRAENNP